MKIRNFSRFAADDYDKAPEYFLNFLDSLNGIIDALNPLLSNGIDLDNNLAGERQTVTLSHGVAINVRLTRVSLPRFLRVGYAQGYVGVGAITGYNADGSVVVTVYFEGTAPTTAVATVLYFEA